MCGIAGIYHLNGPDDIPQDTLESMIGAISHRGPDESGIYLDDNIGLGHARLSIIDLSSGTQPIHNEDQSLWIIYNGEVFNYVELKETLLEKGHCFYTTSDTEVILHLYEEEGPECLKKLNGQFALAIWNAKKKELFLARDRVGIRPVYYTVVNGKLIFASEIKAIFADEDVPRQLDPEAMDQIFTFWTTLTPGTFFRDVFELPPGHYMKAARGKIKIDAYWHIPCYPRAEQINSSPAEISDNIRQLLLDATRIRLRADVPVGCYLSGGLDSSAVTSMVVRNFDSDVRSFGIRFEESNFDEGKHQSQMVNFLGVNHTDIVATNERIGASLPDCLWHIEKPVLRTAPIPLYLLSEVVRRNGYKVVLTGEGADEVFGGYNIFREAKIRRFMAGCPTSKKRADLIGQLYPYIFKNPRLKRSMYSFFTRGLDKIDDPVFSHSIRWANTSKTRMFFSDELQDAIGDYNGCEQVRRNMPADNKNWDYLSRAQYLEIAIFLSNYLLSSQGDRVAMANSLEIRLPYLDYRVIEYMAKVPAKWKITGLDEKHILKKSFEGLLPEEIIRRQKNPYRAPIKQSLLNSKSTGYFHEVLSEKYLKDAGLFDHKKVAMLVKKVQGTDSVSEVDNMALVGIVSTQLIYRQFIEDFPFKEIYSASPDIIIDRRTKTLKSVN